GLTAAAVSCTGTKTEGKPADKVTGPELAKGDKSVERPGVGQPGKTPNAPSRADSGVAAGEPVPPPRPGAPLPPPTEPMPLAPKTSRPVETTPTPPVAKQPERPAPQPQPPVAKQPERPAPQP